MIKAQAAAEPVMDAHTVAASGAASATIFLIIKRGSMRMML